MDKRVELMKGDRDRSLSVMIAEGNTNDFGIRGDEVFSTNGDIVAEYYVYLTDDEGYSESQYSDIVLVRSEDREKVLSAIRRERDQTEEDNDWQILRYFESKFSSLDVICQWLLENHISYRKFYDGNWGTHPSAPNVWDAEQLARIAHAGQKDKAGEDYIEHPLRVANAVTSGIEDRKMSSSLRIVALLHDVLEDTWVTREFLERCCYGEDEIAAIEALTKLPEEENSDAGYEKFIRRAAQNPLAYHVKMADLRDNMDLSRLPETERSSAKVLSRLERYQKALAYLQSTSPPQIETGTSE